MLEWLQGKKTYITGVATIISSLAALVTGSIPLDAGIPAIITAVMGMTIGAKIDRAVALSK